MGLSISISVPKLKLFQRKKVTLQMHESAAVDPPMLLLHESAAVCRGAVDPPI